MWLNHPFFSFTYLYCFVLVVVFKVEFFFVTLVIYLPSNGGNSGTLIETFIFRLSFMLRLLRVCGQESFLVASVDVCLLYFYANRFLFVGELLINVLYHWKMAT